ncbi:hypothetical protein KX928_23425 [Roseobacter sp. YSTF-M11]|uniref:Uncharacterized protein n=1 Tax=Roseobacter insulae TaxID=2859783 RepID=A0A9X1G004_9RHOB|nr:hypothetical protein [Roseobacter insulae]MBW4710752.1 hypothetical protein [Roseobacter insulae]
MPVQKTQVALPDGVSGSLSGDGATLPFTNYRTPAAPVTTLAEVTSLRATHVEVPGATTVAVAAQPSQGRVHVRSDNRLAVDLIDELTVSGSELSVDLIIDGLPETVTVPVAQGLQLKGWAPGWFFMPPVDANGDILFSTAVNHTVTHVDVVGGFTKAQIEAREGIANASQAWLRDNPAFDGNGAHYGDTEALAVDDNRGAQIWGYKKETGPGCHWLLFKRGTTLLQGTANFGSVEGFNGIHFARIGAYGTGAKPVIQFGLNGGSFLVIEGLRFEYRQNIEHQRFCAFVGNESDHTTNFRGNSRIAEFCLFYKNMGWGFVFRPPPASGQWPVKSTREQGSYINGYDSVAYLYNYIGQSGWADGYDPNAAFDFPQPPTQYSHNKYSSGDGENLYCFHSVHEEGSLTGAQDRPGVISVSSIYAMCNLGILVGGGPDSEDQADDPSLDIGTPIPGAQLGNFSFLEDVLIAGAGQKTQSRTAFETARGINFSGDGTGVCNVIIVDSTDGNDGVRAHGVAPSGEAYVISGMGSLKSSTSEIAVLNWIGEADQNVDGISQAVKDATTIDAYARTFLGDGAADRFDFIDAARASSDPVGQWKGFHDFAMAQLNKTPPTSPARTHLFQPGNDNPSNNWNLRSAWDLKVLPGLVPGDSVNLDSYRVASSLSPAHPIEVVDIGADGEFTKFGGQLEINQHVRGGGMFKVGNHRGGSADVLQHGGDMDPDLHVYAGRYRNDGDLLINGNLTIYDRAEMLFGVDTSTATLAANGRIEINGFETRVGFDGAAGGIAQLILPPTGTLAFKSTCVVVVDGLNADTVGQFKYGEVVTGSVSGFTGVVARDVFTSGLKCLLYLRDVTGIPVDNEDVVGIARKGRATTDPLTIGQIDGAATFGIGTIREIRSGLYGAAPNVDSRVTLDGGLEVDVTGLAPNTYDLIVADTLTGDFASVSITGGTGSVAPPSGGAVVLTVT